MLLFSVKRYHYFSFSDQPVLYFLVVACLFGGAIIVPASSSEAKVFTNQIAINCQDESVAQEIARKHNLRYLGQIGDLEGHFLLESNHIQKRSTEENTHHVEKLRNERSVFWVEQQHEKRRFKRDYLVDQEMFKSFDETSYVKKRGARTTKSAPRDFTDVLYNKQWYLHHGAKGSNDMNVIPAWEKGYSGKNVVVTILDDGIQTDHPDLIDNYDPKASFDINDNDDDPMPQNNDDNKHGTRCAGEIASMAFNNYCGVGIAYNAKIGGVRMLDGRVTDAVEAKALSHNPQHIDIYSASWGPEDNGATVDGPGRLAKLSFTNGIDKGRGGKGSIFVWASGNGGRYSDNCNCDGYTNSIYTLSISSATHNNVKPWYLEQCSSTLATTYSSGQPGSDPNVVTVDMDRTYLEALKKGRVGDPSKLCTERHTGTSASAPMAAGMCALALEANPNLTWRDMQHIVVLTSRYEPLSEEGGWITNGVKRKVSHKFGYGLMDGEQMVNLASTWKTVPQQRKCDSIEDNTQRKIPTSYHGMVKTSIYSDGCKNSQSEIRYLEHVQATITLNFKPRGNLLIKLVSPMGTHSTLLFPRPRDLNDNSFNNWPFLSVHFWGENPVGNWTLTILNAGVSMANSPGILVKWSLTMFGTHENPAYKNNVTPNIYTPETYTGPCDEECLSGCFGSGPDQCYTCKHFRMESSPRICVVMCPKDYFPDDGICKQCHSSCKTCFGPHANDCQSCKPRHYLKLDEMACVKTCPTGFFTNEEMRLCIMCESQCKSCSKSPHHCDECVDALVMVRQHECDSNCPSHSYRSTLSNRCEKCTTDCKECFGPNSNQCINCFSGMFLVDGSCKPYCNNNTFADLKDQVCYSCNPLCKTCTSDDFCDSCIDGHTMTRSHCIPIQNCKSDGCHCEESCRTCMESPNRITCTSCKAAFKLVDGRCTESCPDGHFSSKDNTCWPCFNGCSQCYGPKIDECTACPNDFVLHQGRCLPVCPQKYYKARGGICRACNSLCRSCISKNDCISCPRNHYYMSRKCVSSCPVGYHSTGTRRCIKCHHSCASCSADGAFACKSCNAGELSEKGNCVPCSYNQYFDRDKKICSYCDKTCKTCSGPSEMSCDSCILPLKFESARHSCVPCCPIGETPNYSCCYCDQRTGMCSRTIPSYVHITWTNKKSDDNSDALSRLKWLSVAVCVCAVVLFFMVFCILQLCSHKKPSHDYAPLSQQLDTGVDKVALTSENMEDEEATVQS